MDNTIEMTNEQAAIIIGNLPINGEDDCYSISKYQWAKTKAIDALTRRVDVDSISRKEAIECLNTDGETVESYKANVSKKIESLEEVSVMMEKAFIEKLQMDVSLAYDRGYAEAKEKYDRVGAWLINDHGNSIDTIHTCSLCSSKQAFGGNFCHECGARMVDTRHI